MTVNSACLEIDPVCVELILRTKAVDMVNSAEGEVVLDFSSVLRIDAAAATAFGDLAGLAAQRSVRIVLRSVNIRIYKALNLLKLVRSFTFEC